MTTDRRTFLGLGAAATAGVALGGAALSANQASADEAVAPEASDVPAWLGEEPQIDESEIVETRETDFLIIGAGTAGLCAAATAAEQGMDFMICDHSAFVPETREYLGAVNTKYTLEAGGEIDPGKLLNEITRYASGKCSQDVIKVWIDESAEMVEWMDGIMEEAGTGKAIVLDTPEQHGTGGTDYFVPWVQHMYVPNPYVPPTRNDVLQAHIEELGYAINWEWELIKLVHADGKVTGAVFGTDQGYVQVNANNTLLATGGYPANAEMMEALQPAACRCITANSYNNYDDGMGLKAGIWAGGVKDPDPAPMIFDRGAVMPGVDAGWVHDGDSAKLPGEIFQENIGSQPFMKVNRRGQRFANESTPYDFICFAASNQPGGVWCQVFDGNAPEDMIRFDTVGCSRVAPDFESGSLALEDYIATSLDAGCMMKADTIEELADKLGFEGEDKERFLAQVERYNELYDNQLDEDFGKEPYRLSAIKTAPFYGCWFGGSLLTTIDGLRINKDCQVLDKDCNVIEGFYAAGDVSGCFFSGNYPEYIVGVAAGRTSVQGRHVARLLGGALEAE